MVNNKETKLSDILTGKSEKNDAINKNDGRVKKGVQYEGRTPKHIKYDNDTCHSCKSYFILL